MNISDLRYEVLTDISDEEKRRDAELWVMAALDISKTQFILGSRPVSPCEYNKIKEGLARLKKGEPLNYLTGKCEFMSLPFYVDKNVLIPRSDTEILVEALIDILPNDKKITILDLCSGSGCIGISLAYYLKNAEVTMIDISENAVEIEKKNALINGVYDRCEFGVMDIMEEFPEREYDCVVSNPPYIKTDVIETLDKKVKEFEPRIALDGGYDGLDFYRRISEKAKISHNGIICFETGFDQSESVTDILFENGYKDCKIIYDIEKRGRVCIVRNS